MITTLIDTLRSWSQVNVFLVSSLLLIVIFIAVNWWNRRNWEKSEKYPERLAYRYNQEIAKLKDEITNYKNILSEKRIDRAKELSNKLGKYLSKRESIYEILIKDQLSQSNQEKDIERVNALVKYFMDNFGDSGVDLGHYRAALIANDLGLAGAKSKNLQWIGLDRGYTAMHHQIYCSELLKYFEDYLDALDYVAHYKLLVGYVLPAKKDWISHYKILHEEDRFNDDVKQKQRRLNRRIGELLNGEETH